MKNKYSIPENWVWAKHEDISVINPKSLDYDLNEDSDVSFLPMACVEEVSGCYNLKNIRKHKDVKKGYTSFVNGDLIFAKITPCMENGKVAVLDNLVNGVGYGSTEFHVSRLHSSIDKKYLFFFVIQTAFRKEAKRNMTGSAGQLRVPTVFFKSVLIPIPPKPEQRSIVSKIEQLFSELDNGIACLKKAQEQLKVYRQAVLKQAFEGELTKSWREQQANLPSAQDLLDTIKAEREQAAKNQGKKLKPVIPLTQAELDDLPALPAGWGWVRLGDFNDILGGVTKGRKLEGKKTIDLPYLRVANVQDGYLNLKEIKKISVLEGDLNRYKLQDGDILYTEGGDKDKLGRGAIWRNQIEKCIHQNHIFRARSILKNAVPDFVAYYSQAKSAKKYFYSKAKQTVNLASINLTVLSQLPFPFCSSKCVSGEEGTLTTT